MPRILLLGAHGQVGQELQTALTPVGDITAYGRDKANFTAPEQLHQIIAPVQPDIIVNAAAYTAVDRAETEPDLAHLVNEKAPTSLAESAKQLGAMLVHLSTDYVFDGTQSHPYTESDPPNPQGVYGRSKWLGEQGIRQTHDSHIILRTAWVYGQQGKGNFVKTMLRLGAERQEVRVVDDQVGTPTWAKDIGDAIASLIRHWSTLDATAKANFYGTYHFTNRGVASWYDLAVAIFAEAQALGIPLQVKQVTPIPTVEYPLPAPRPAYSVLSNHKITPILGQPASHWRDALRQMLQTLSP
ncbi:dTDP-4-dehydrorhamnose reductase [Acaryochloris sp. IP29b_bin.148]|uniref:dTDP-4-dehydrorhamnose reductase n=1 Tax=Acaryochloris sp. IP29b_bin.148 TaxID=2969218 RepID=UPI00261593E2|nr:dTDP-4-dehydrorhamnose reductase [Acaryochloris sp. IP29b_bin.148]